MGDAYKVVEKYLDGGSGVNRAAVQWSLAEAPGCDKAKITRVSVSGARQPESGRADLDEPLTLKVMFEVLEPGQLLHTQVHVYNADDVDVFETGPSTDPNWFGKRHPAGTFESCCIIPKNLLNDGTYHFNVYLIEDCARCLATIEKAVSIEMIDHGKGRSGWLGKWAGTVRPQIDWVTSKLDE
jgi:lipopolysaccharide transport system ATP-binding protein